MTELATRNPSQQLVARVRSDEFKQQVAMALPPTVTTERFVRVASTALLANPDIAKLDHDSVLRAMVQAASIGLIPDGKEAAIVGRGGQAVFQPMIGGFRRIAAEHGWDLKTKAIYANDEFAYTEEPESVTHTPCRPDRDRGDLIGAYAKATHKDGRVKYRVMFEADIAKRRAQATTQSVWSKWPAEMYEKTAGRDLFADLPLAESDLERERIKRLLAEDLPGAAADVLYPARREELPALPAAAASASDASTMAATSDRHETGAAGQQAGGATEETEGPLPASDVAPPVPGTDTEEEPDVGGSEGYNTPATVPGDDAVVAAGQAAGFTIPNGKNRGKTLAEVHATGDDGVSWIGWALRNIGWPTPKTESDEQYRNAVWAFARVHEPDLYQGVYASKQAEGLI
jgi:recombination protein RecT